MECLAQRTAVRFPLRSPWQPPFTSSLLLYATTLSQKHNAAPKVSKRHYCASTPRKPLRSLHKPLVPALLPSYIFLPRVAPTTTTSVHCHCENILPTLYTLSTLRLTLQSSLRTKSLHSCVFFLFFTTTLPHIPPRQLHAQRRPPATL